MALIHERLYGKEDLREIDMNLYIHDISSFLSSSYGIKPDKIEIRILCEKVFLGINKAIPCGLIVNEIITNAFKHGFVGREKGAISIHFSGNGKHYELAIEDDGIGIPKEGEVPDEAQSLGLRLIKLLAEQLGATIQVESQTGTKFMLRFTP
jgi:two-component sensor histidine kinase